MCHFFKIEDVFCCLPSVKAGYWAFGRNTYSCLNHYRVSKKLSQIQIAKSWFFKIKHPVYFLIFAKTFIALLHHLGAYFLTLWRNLNYLKLLLSNGDDQKIIQKSIKRISFGIFISPKKIKAKLENVYCLQIFFCIL